VNCRPLTALCVAQLALATTLLACVPNPSMTRAEMECCRKMAGNCDMGNGNHKCCNVTVNRSAPVAAIAHSYNVHKIAAPMIVVDTRDEGSSPRVAASINSPLALFSSSPPGFPTVLRL
jgi:hypothetical protein